MMPSRRTRRREHHPIGESGILGQPGAGCGITTSGTLLSENGYEGPITSRRKLIFLLSLCGEADIIPIDQIFRGPETTAAIHSWRNTHMLTRARTSSTVALFFLLSWGIPVRADLTKGSETVTGDRGA